MSVTYAKGIILLIGVLTSVVCLANLTSHVIARDRIKLGVMCLQGDHNTSPGSTAHNAPRKPHSCDLELG